MAVVAVACALVYGPGLKGGFYFDDFRNITHNRTLRMPEVTWEGIRGFATGPSGNRPVSLLSFALHFVLGFTEPWHFRVVNVAIHLAATFLVGFTARRVFSVAGIGANRALVYSAAVAGVWALHPMQLTAVTYIVQRMTSLAALFFWGAMYLYLVARMSIAREGARRWVRYGAGAGAALCFVLGMLAKSHIAIFAPIVIATEMILFGTHRRLTRRQWGVASGVVLGFALLVGITRSAEIATFLENLTDLSRPVLESRGGTPWNRLITEPRVLFLYLSLFFFPVWSRFSLFWSFDVSRGLVHPPQTLLSILGIGALIYLAWRWRRKMPLASWGLTCFLLGHVIEGTVMPLYLVFEHRMYLPSVFLLAALVGLVEVVRARWFVDVGKVRVAGVALVVALLAVLGSQTFRRNQVWGDPNALFLHEIECNPGNYQVKVNYAMHLLSVAEGVDQDAGVEYATRLIEELEGLDLDEELKIRLKKIHSNLALFYMDVRQDYDQGLEHMLAAAEYGYTPTIMSRLASFYFAVRIDGQVDYMERLKARGYDDDERMLGFLEVAYDMGLTDWLVTANLINACIFLAKEDGKAKYADRARAVLQENLVRYADDPERVRRLREMAKSLDLATSRGER
jgi:hypothetical protein